MVEKKQEEIQAKEVVQNPVIHSETKSKKNPWIYSTVIFLIVAIILSFFALKGGVSGNVVSEKDATNKLVSYLGAKVGGGVTLVSSKDSGSLYEVTVSYQGNEIPVYVTKDGKYFVQGVTPIVDSAGNQTPAPAQPAAQSVPKSDKPLVEAFIFSYCPYGLQFEKALFPVYDALKSKADINIVAIGAMHGEFEKIESLRQISVEQIYGRDKLFAYLKEFNSNTNIGSCSGDATCLDKYLPAIYKKLGIDKTKVDNYLKTSAEKIYNEQVAKASGLGIGGSPTFVINGVEVQVGRTPEAIKQAVCNAFNTAPSECSQNLSAASASPGFGASAATGSASAAQC